MTIAQNPRLFQMLSTKRPHNSVAEEEWIERFIRPVGIAEVENAALICVVDYPDGTASKTLFSAHTDTVHRDDGPQTIFIEPDKHFYHKLDDEPLGADCGAGCWLMLEMIEAKVPGTYVFHRGEERGGIGSRHMAAVYDDWLKQFDRAVAFDRKGVGDVITHQWGGRCCSDEFAQALADALNAQHDDFMYLPDSTGVFTDTANYTDLIPECTNISVGYESEHTGRERLHLPHIYALRDALIRVEWDALPTKRDPTAVDAMDCVVYGTDWLDRRDRSLPKSDYTDYDNVDFYGMPLGEMTRADMERYIAFDPESFLDVVQDYIDDVVASRHRNRRLAS